MIKGERRELEGFSKSKECELEKANLEINLYVQDNYYFLSRRQAETFF